MTQPAETPTPIVIESKTSVKLTRNAKGDVQWELKIVEGTTAPEVEHLKTLAITAHNDLLQTFARNAA